MANEKFKIEINKLVDRGVSEKSAETQDKIAELIMDLYDEEGLEYTIGVLESAKMYLYSRVM